jgi:hypothetical protein
VATLTLTELQTRVRQRADLALSDQFIPTSELTIYINLALSKMWDLALENDGQSFIPYTDVPFTAPTTAPNIYALPNAYKVLSVQLWDSVAGGVRRPIFPAMETQIPGLMSQQASANITFGAMYRLSGGFGLASTAGLQLQLFPPPLTNTVLQVRYVPPAPTLVNDTTPVMFPNGWEEFVVLEAAIKCIGKEDGDTRELQRQRDEMAESIRTASSSLDRGSPERVQDVVYGLVDYPWGNGGW